MSATGDLVGNFRILGVLQRILARPDFDFFDSIDPQEKFKIVAMGLASDQDECFAHDAKCLYIQVYFPMMT